MERRANSFDIAFATELADETAARLQAIRHAFNNFFRLPHPMQRGIAKHGVETRLEAEPLPVHHRREQAALLRRQDLSRAGIDADHKAAESGDFLGQSAIAAAEIQNPLVRARIEELQ